MLFGDMGGYGDSENPGDAPTRKIPFLKLKLPSQFSFSLRIRLYALYFLFMSETGTDIEASCLGVGEGPVTDFSSLPSAFSSS